MRGFGSAEKFAFLRRHGQLRGATLTLYDGLAGDVTLFGGDTRINTRLSGALTWAPGTVSATSATGCGARPRALSHPLIAVQGWKDLHINIVLPVARPRF